MWTSETPPLHVPLPLVFDELATVIRVLTMALDAAGQVGPGMPIRDARLFAEAQVSIRGELTPLSAETVFAHWRKFETFLARGHGVTSVGGITPTLVEAFVSARTSRGRPAAATRRGRCSSLRLLFREFRRYQLFEGDPTVDMLLPSRPRLVSRPLTDDEVERCRWAALFTVGATRQPAVWALGEAGASTREIAKVTAADLDLSAGQVWLHGAPRTDARWAPLTDWGATQLGRRTRNAGMLPHSPVAFDRPVDEQAGRISAGAALLDVMARAGLAGRRDVKPRSLAAWVGRRVFLDTGRVDEAARRLGMRSLDLTAELIGFDWREERA